VTNNAVKVAVVAGAAGFIGSHLCDFLLAKNYRVIGLDNFVTGREQNIAHLKSNDNFSFFKCDITQKDQFPKIEKIDEIYNLASPASPVDFLKIPIFILQTGAFGQMNMLDLAEKTGARILYASTSEVYGDPLVHPQKEEYLGNVNPVGIRGCYDESKRFGEAITMAYHREKKVNTAIVRIFNTYGPRMRPEDGRVIPNFFTQALKKESLTLYGEGHQTRSLCYVTDLIQGFWQLMQSQIHLPVNIGNPKEMTIKDLADTVNELVGNNQPHQFKPLPPDDPQRRCPDITKARRELQWEPKVNLKQGLTETFSYFKKGI
jgi:dTDP-glucose 4,6-dehydratase